MRARLLLSRCFRRPPARFQPNTIVPHRIASEPSRKRSIAGCHFRPVFSILGPLWFLD